MLSAVDVDEPENQSSPTYFNIRASISVRNSFSHLACAIHSVNADLAQSLCGTPLTSTMCVSHQSQHEISTTELQPFQFPTIVSLTHVPPDRERRILHAQDFVDRC
jgi:hypothetical protein